MTSETKPARSMTTSIKLDAPVERVWAAFTEAEHYTNWFPLRAKIEPGVGGKVFGTWGEDWSEGATIEVWEPNQRLVTSMEMPWRGSEPVMITQDFELHANGDGTTGLRLVHSGFGDSEAWDDLYDATKRGWAFELRGLAHYLSRHWGTKREVVHVRRAIPEVTMDVWKRLMSALGAPGDIETKQEGDTYRLAPIAGEPLEGTIRVCNPPKDLAATVSNLNDAYFRVRIDFACSDAGANEINLWVSTYGLSEERRERVASQFQGVMDRAVG